MWSLFQIQPGALLILNPGHFLISSVNVKSRTLPLSALLMLNPGPFPYQSPESQIPPNPFLHYCGKTLKINVGICDYIMSILI